MIPSFFSRKPSQRDAIFAEAQSLLDDGLEVDFLLALYPEDAEWLEPLLRTADAVSTTLRAEEPSFYFEASLKSRFLAAGAARAAEEEEAETATGRFGFIPQMQTAAASMAVVGGAAIIGVLTLGFVTADQAVPGDWNYNLKRASERVEYVLASGPERVDVELRHKQERVSEIERLVARGTVTPQHIERVYRDLQEVAEIGNGTPLEPHQEAHVRAIAETTSDVLSTVRERQPELAEMVDEAMTFAAGLGNGGSTPLPAPEPTATPAPTATPTAEPTATPEPTSTVETPPPPPATSTPTPRPAPTRTPTPAPTATPTETVSPIETPMPTTEPDPTRTPDPGDDDDEPAATATGTSDDPNSD